MRGPSERSGLMPGLGRLRQLYVVAVAVFATVISVDLPAVGLLHAETLSGPQIREIFTGNTVGGVYVGGNPFSEFHAADGRVLGDNGYTLNVDACWNTDGDRVCYHYGPKEDRRTYCFKVEINDASYNLRVADTGRLNAVASVEKGNPQRHGDGGKRWSCDDLLARAPGGRAPVVATFSRFMAPARFRMTPGGNARGNDHDFDTNHSLRVYPVNATIRP